MGARNSVPYLHRHFHSAAKNFILKMLINKFSKLAETGWGCHCDGTTKWKVEDPKEIDIFFSRYNG